MEVTEQRPTKRSAPSTETSRKKSKLTLADVETRLALCGMQWLRGVLSEWTWERAFDAVVRDMPIKPQPRRWGNMVFPGAIRYAAYKRPGVDVPPYEFSGVVVEAKDMPKEMMELHAVAQKATGIDYDMALVNLYESNEHGAKLTLTIHTDDETTMDPNFDVCSMSFRKTSEFPRRFVVHTVPHSKDSANRVEVPLRHQDVFVGRLSNHYHGILDDPVTYKRSGQSLDHICITWRKVRRS